MSYVRVGWQGPTPFNLHRGLLCGLARFNGHLSCHLVNIVLVTSRFIREDRRAILAICRLGVVNGPVEFGNQLLLVNS